ncbi:hypothetical protein Lalb_Chr23g0276681 [Lupinus albus]|uniref:Uncharacterized protein n=1 Tax=Lupinus albus TaxID=3870 RepID=A0A6A4NM08_LUPAL|nr:hypothetical protein Lalb_Chr23g0276681 [Lupinus albus]
MFHSFFFSFIFLTHLSISIVDIFLQFFFLLPQTSFFIFPSSSMKSDTEFFFIHR